MNFDPNKMGQRAPSKASNSNENRGPKPERLFLVVSGYETPANGFHFAIGHLVGQTGEVRVRLNTVAERKKDRPNDSEDKIKAQYVSGENTRDSISEKSKSGIKLISFDDARLLSNTDGVREYRAHWPKTMSTNPEAEVVSGLAHIRLREAGEVNGKHRQAQAYVELVSTTNRVTGDDVQARLLQGLAIKDADGRARDPFVILRAEYEGKVVASPRIYPSTTTEQVFDQTLGANKDVTRKVDAEDTLSFLLSSDAGRDDFANRQLDTARAIVAGLTGAEEPKFHSADNVAAEIRNLYYGVKEGQIKVDVVGLEKIDFGADSRKTYVKDKDRPQLAGYTIKEPYLSGGEEKVREAAGFTRTVIAFHRHQDGEPYAVFASPEAMYPKMQKFNDLKLGPTAEATLEAAAQAEQPAEPEHEEPALSGLADEEPAF